MAQSARKTRIPVSQEVGTRKLVRLSLGFRQSMSQIPPGWVSWSLIKHGVGKICSNLMITRRLCCISQALGESIQLVCICQFCPGREPEPACGSPTSCAGRETFLLRGATFEVAASQPGTSVRQCALAFARAAEWRWRLSKRLIVHQEVVKSRVYVHWLGGELEFGGRRARRALRRVVRVVALFGRLVLVVFALFVLDAAFLDEIVVSVFYGDVREIAQILGLNLCPVPAAAFDGGDKEVVGFLGPFGS